MTNQVPGLLIDSTLDMTRAPKFPSLAGRVVTEIAGVFDPLMSAQLVFLSRRRIVKSKIELIDKKNVH